MQSASGGGASPEVLAAFYYLLSKLNHVVSHSVGNPSVIRLRTGTVAIRPGERPGTAEVEIAAGGGEAARATAEIHPDGLSELCERVIDVCWRRSREDSRGRSSG